ncbi:MAG: hypothetical protein GXX84_12370 [Acidobacteria bacterium]|nr:hypothetical protein [Acidobacteriota bacterium]
MKTYGWLGLSLLVVSGYFLSRRIEPFTAWFYCFAWWSYILLADNLLLKLRGRSLLVSRRREFWGMLPISVFIWLLFEAYNFVINNWSYDAVPPQTWLRWPGYALAFSTVLPGIFITSDLVELVFGRSTRPAASEYEPIEEPRPAPSPLFIVVGLLLTAAPLVLPTYFFAAVWLGPIFFLDPLLEKFGIRSLSLSIHSGERTRVWSLMLGGFICGLIWEFWNFWAGAKWIYSVPFFDRPKIFEMPLLGFLGFPPFALECWILYHLVRAVPRRMVSSAARIAWWMALAALSLAVLRGIDRHTVLRFAAVVTDKADSCKNLVAFAVPDDKLQDVSYSNRGGSEYFGVSGMSRFPALFFD